MSSYSASYLTESQFYSSVKWELYFPERAKCLVQYSYVSFSILTHPSSPQDLYFSILWAHICRMHVSNTNQLVFASLHPPTHPVYYYIRWFFFKTQICSVCPLLKTLPCTLFLSGERWDPSPDCWCPACSGLPPPLISPEAPLASHHHTNPCAVSDSSPCFLLLMGLLHRLLPPSEMLFPLPFTWLTPPCPAPAPPPQRIQSGHPHLSLAHISFTAIFHGANYTVLCVWLCYEVCLSGYKLHEIRKDVALCSPLYPSAQHCAWHMVSMQ